MSDKNDLNYTGKIVLQGKLCLLSPALVGNGDTENSDADVLRNAQGIPYIPATSFVGVLRHFMESKINSLCKNFFGYVNEKENSAQTSALSCKDLHLTNDSKCNVTIRDGIKIDSQRGIVEEQKKYDYEILEPVTCKETNKTTCFSLEIWINCKKENIESYQKVARTIQHILEKEFIRVGAKTNNGMGKLKLIESNLIYLDFTKKHDVLAWLKQDFAKKEQIKATPIEIEDKDFALNVYFRIPKSLIIRSYSTKPDAPDAVHLKVNGKYVLTGSTLKGAFRGRAERILNTLKKDSEKIVTGIFGNMDEKNPKYRPICGRVRIEETVLKDVKPELQARIKIDRFTAGTIETALFETEPLFSTTDEYIQRIQLTTKDCKKHEAGLLLLILKDLFTGDLAIGGEKNIGRGILEGGKAEIRWQGKRLEIGIDKNKKPVVSPEDREELEGLVNKLVTYENEENHAQQR